MKVFGAPEGITLTPDYSNYNREAEREKEEKYKADIKDWLLKNGFSGPLTGEIASFGVADGYAQYMFGDAGRSSILIHLNIGDGYSFPYIERLAKSDIVAAIERGKNMRAIFGKH